MADYASLSLKADADHFTIGFQTPKANTAQ
jgi:hypothetical protein